MSCSNLTDGAVGQFGQTQSCTQQAAVGSPVRFLAIRDGGKDCSLGLPSIWDGVIDSQLDAMATTGLAHTLDQHPGVNGGTEVLTSTAEPA